MSEWTPPEGFVEDSPECDLHGSPSRVCCWTRFGPFEVARYHENGVVRWCIEDLRAEHGGILHDLYDTKVEAEVAARSLAQSKHERVSATDEGAK